MAPANSAEARSYRLAPLVSGCVAFALSAALAAALWPLPLVQDEFAYLLAGDTFAHLRLTNPTPPAWVFFESIHINVVPTYMAKYPPLQGLFLAVGQLLTGQPLVGVWLSMGLAAAAVAWMIGVWTDRRTGLVGGLLVATHGLVISQWGATFWGGAAALLAGALLLGGAWASLERTDRRSGVVAAVGLVLLAICRPFEGLALAVALALVVLVRLRALDAGRRADWLRRVVPPALAVLIAGGAFMGYYNHRLTGSALTLPYVVNNRQYLPNPLFSFQPARPMPEYRHEALRRFYMEYAIRPYENRSNLRGYLRGVKRKLLDYGRFFLSLPLGIAALAGLALAGRRLAAALVVLAVASAAVSLSVYEVPHYFAPMAPLLFLFAAAGLRRLAAVRQRGWPLGLVAALLLVAASLYQYWGQGLSNLSRRAAHPVRSRAAIEQQLRQAGGGHLILVRYAEDHEVHYEWVYNAAEIESAPVVWARDMGAERNRELLRRFADRQVHMFCPDASVQQLLPYPGAAEAAGSGPECASAAAG